MPTPTLPLEVASTDLQRYTDRVYGFQVTIPTDWIRDSSDEPLDLYHPTTDTRVVLWKQVGGSTTSSQPLEQVGQDYTLVLRDVPGFVKFLHNGIVEQRGVRWYDLQYRTKNPFTDEERTVWLGLRIIGGYIGVFAGDGLADTWDEILPDIYTIIATFDPPDPKTLTIDYQAESEFDVITRRYSIFYPNWEIEYECIPKGTGPGRTVTSQVGLWSNVATCAPGATVFSGLSGTFGTPDLLLELRLANVEAIEVQLREVLGSHSQ